jgi:hypothetical protein
LRATPTTVGEWAVEGAAGVIVAGTLTVGVVEAGVVAVGGTAVVGVAVGGATVPGWAPVAGAVVVGVVVAGVAAAGAFVVPWTRADAGTGNVGVEDVWLVVLAVDAPAGEPAVSATKANATVAHAVVRGRRKLQLAPAIIAVAMLTVVGEPGGRPVSTN